MDAKEELIKAFEFIGQNVNDKIIDKCLQLCAEYEITIEDFVDQWSAFSMTKLKNANVNLEGLLLMERKELTKMKNALNSSNTSKEATPITTPKSVKRPPSPTREDNIQEKNTEYESTSYSERSDSGEVVKTYGPKKDFSHSDTEVSVKIVAKSDWYKPGKFRFLHLTQTKAASAFSDAIDLLSNIIFTRNKLGSTSDVNVSKSNDVVICGRIKTEDVHGRLNQVTIKLESSYSFNNAKTTSLNITRTKTFNLFPGQIAAVRGINTFGNSFIAQEFFVDGTPPPSNEEIKITDSLQIVVAAGPFTTCDNLLYEPLQDLLKHVVETKPNVLILLGPLIDANHNALGDMMETFETYFDSLITSIMECFKFNIQVVLIPSTKDIHHCPIYPLPAYKIKQDYPNLICAPDPCMLNINGVIVGATSMDILFHLSKEEISRQPQNSDRMARLASHLLNQRSFYPLYPSDKSAHIEYRRLLSDCQMEVKPHILILPSTLRCCVKNVENCLFINPERLVKNRIGGTFAKISIGPITENVDIINKISCEILKI